MPREKSLCVVIPVHKAILSWEEKISLQACKRHLNDYDCYLIFPESMAVDAYIEIFDHLHLTPVKAEWLSSVEHYNKMKLNLSFYNIFKAYNYMLTYELDAYIFHSNFDKANVFSFDFIGAPFFQGYLNASPDAPFIDGCNSGFSVRNITHCIQVLQSMPKYRNRWNIYNRILSKVPRFSYHLNRLTKKKFDIYITGKLGFYFGGYHINEDQVWSQIVPRLFKSFNVADPVSASRFSFEHNPGRLFELNGRELPLGCHAWSKYENFWKKYIID